MYQFKSNNNNLKEVLKFGKPKSPQTQKSTPAVHSKNVSASFFGKESTPMKAVNSSWKKGATVTFPNRPETHYTPYTLSQPVTTRESMPLGQLEININQQSFSVEPSKPSQMLNLNSSTGDLVRTSTSLERAVSTQPFRCSTDRPDEYESEVNRLNNNLREALRKKEQFERKFEEANEELARVKETNRDQSKKIIQLTNANNQLQADLFITSQKLKERDESDSAVSKQNEYKRLVVELSQQKSELINKVSELLEEKARKDNTQTFNKIEKSRIENQLENTRIEQLQQIQLLKSRVNELQQDSNQNQKEYYQERIRLLEKEVKQLLMKCMAKSSQGSSFQKMAVSNGGVTDLSQLRLMVENQHLQSEKIMVYGKENYGRPN